MRYAILVLLLLALAACTTTVVVCADGSKVSDLSECPPTKKTTVEEVKEAPPTTPPPKPSPKVVTSDPIDEDVADILANKKRIQSISYHYKEDRAATAPRSHVFLKGDMQRMLLPAPTGNVLHTQEIDTIIFSGKKATAYCESIKHCIERGEYDVVDYDKYYKKTPFDWDVKGKIVGGELDSGSKIAIVEDSDGTKYHVHEYYGVPVKVEQNGQVFIYEKAAFNGVTADDLKYQLRE